MPNVRELYNPKSIYKIWKTESHQSVYIEGVDCSLQWKDFRLCFTKQNRILSTPKTFIQHFLYPSMHNYKWTAPGTIVIENGVTISILKLLPELLSTSVEVPVNKFVTQTMFFNFTPANQQVFSAA